MPTEPRDTAYSDTPLAKKLGILTTRDEIGKAPREVAILAAPDNFLPQLGDLPANVHLRKSISPNTTLAIIFIRTLAELDAALDLLESKLPRKASAWIVRPKTHHKPGFNENHVRDGALPEAWSTTRSAPLTPTGRASSSRGANLNFDAQ